MATTLTKNDLKGNWVTSHSGWMHFEPRQQPVQPGDPVPPPLPPQFPGVGYDPNTDSFSEREGYFVFAALVALYLDEKGNVSGTRFMNRGGKGYLTVELIGDYILEENPVPGVYTGTIHLRNTNLGGIVVDNYLTFIARNAEELEWVWKNGTYEGTDAGGNPTTIDAAYRALVTHGTLKKVTRYPE